MFPGWIKGESQKATIQQAHVAGTKTSFKFEDSLEYCQHGCSVFENDLVANDLMVVFGDGAIRMVGQVRSDQIFEVVEIEFPNEEPVHEDG